MNFLLLIGEDTGRHLGCYGDAYARTPHLDALAADGCRYTHGFTHTPVCAPSRGGLVTSRYPYSLGNHLMRSKLVDPPRMFTHELRDAGYHVSWPTKLDFNFEPTAGWTDDTDAWWDRDAPPGQGKPFFAYRNVAWTHESGMWGTKDWGNDKTLDDLAADMGITPHDPAQAPVPPYVPDTEPVRQNVARYYTALEMQDKQFGDCLAALDRWGVADDTVVIYLTDHGRGLPREKRWCYEAGIHLPLIIRAPGLTATGSVDDQLVNWVDIAPTVLSLAGIARPDAYQGQVFLGEDAAEPRDYCFAGRDRMDEQFDRVRACRDAKYLYLRNDFPQLPYMQRNRYMETIEATQELRRLRREDDLEGPPADFMAVNKPDEELYDCDADPHCVNNLAGDADYKDHLQRLRRALQQHLDAVGDHGQRPERELVDAGLIQDQIDEYRDRVGPLPEPDRIIPEPTAFELHEAQAIPRRS
jgi:arylsulfatase A-like enzyme